MIITKPHRSIVLALALACAHCITGDRNPDNSHGPPIAAAHVTPVNVGAASLAAPTLATDAAAADVVAFWRDAGPARWFAKDPEFDREFREKFASLFDRAARNELDAWLNAPVSALALVLLLDQYPRNSFRGTPRMYATDDPARRAADVAIARGHDHHVDADLQVFFYLPFAHSEQLGDQERSVALCRRLGAKNSAHAEHHRDIVKRFGRFPHRNAILGRATTPDEAAYLADGGFAG